MAAHTVRTEASVQEQHAEYLFAFRRVPNAVWKGKQQIVMTKQAGGRHLTHDTDEPAMKQEVK